jgi:hypothetical protein
MACSIARAAAAATALLIGLLRQGPLAYNDHRWMVARKTEYLLDLRIAVGRAPGRHAGILPPVLDGRQAVSFQLSL